MASNRHTPESVLSAPSRSTEVLSPQIGVTRREKRHGLLSVPKGLMPGYLAVLRAAGENEPARSARGRRGKKVKRNRAAS